MAKKSRPLYMTREAYEKQQAEAAERTEARKAQLAAKREHEARAREERQQKRTEHRAKIEGVREAAQQADNALAGLLQIAENARTIAAEAARTRGEDILRAKGEVSSLEAERDRLLAKLDEVDAKLGSKLGRLRTMEQSSPRMLADKADAAVAAVRAAWTKADTAWQAVSTGWRKKNRDRKLKNRAKELLGI